MAEKFYPIKAYFSPGRDPQQNICGFVDRLEKTLDAAVFSFTDSVIKDAVKRALNRKVRIRLVVDAEQASGQAMAKVLEELKAAGVDIRADRESGFMHDKYAIGDGKAVITGSYNWTVRAQQRNRENLVVIRKKSTKKNWLVDFVLTPYKQNFEEIWAKNAPPVVVASPPTPPPS